MARQHRLSTQGGLITGLAVVGAGLTWPTVLPSVEAAQGDDFPHTIEALATLLLAALSAWILLIVAAELVAVRLPGVPHVVRAAMFTGTALALTIPAAQADGTHDVSGLPLPDRPIIGAPPTPLGDPTVTVRPGDTLWGLAAAALPDDASAAHIAEATRAWHRLNHDVIGPDPDLILPGQVLKVVR